MARIKKSGFCKYCGMEKRECAKVRSQIGEPCCTRCTHRYKSLSRNPVKVRESRARFIHEPLQSKKKFDPRSFRTKVSRAHRITFGCPKGKWSPTLEECKVPVQIQKILHPMEEAMLSNPCPLSNPKRLTTRKDWGSLPKAKYMTRQEKKFWKEYYEKLYGTKRKPIKRNPKGKVPYSKWELKVLYYQHNKGMSLEQAKYWANKWFKDRGYNVVENLRTVMLNPKRKPLIEKGSYYKWYVGVFKKGLKGKAFYSSKKPSLITHGHLYKFVTGPFESKSEAQKWVRFMGWDVVR